MELRRYSDNGNERKSIMIYADKKIIVCGMARSGIAAARLLDSLGADVHCRI